MPRSSLLRTIGYEQATQAAVLDELAAAGVKLLVDVRAIAASRRPGFSKRVLAASLDERGIAYLHLRKLGTPAAGRQAARSGDVETLWAVYDKHLATPQAQEQLDELVALVGSGQKICLLCYCRDAAACHRRRIVEALHDRVSIKVEDLAPPLF